MSDDLTFSNELFLEYADSSERYIPNETIWHYTSLTGLKGITDNSPMLSLWFTNKDYLNDSSEGQEIMQIFKKVCKDSYKSGKISKDFYDAIKNISLSTKKAFLSESVLNVDEYQLYVCCFARDGDLLDLWRYYSKHERGYSLKFNTRIVNAIENKYRSQGVNKIYAFNVIYSDSKKKELIQEKILKLYTIYQKYACKDYPEKRKSIKAALSYFLTLNQLMFKNNCFSSEKEL